jgi:hypothetical protein
MLWGVMLVASSLWMETSMAFLLLEYKDVNGDRVFIVSVGERLVILQRGGDIFRNAW